MHLPSTSDMSSPSSPNHSQPNPILIRHHDKQEWDNENRICRLYYALTTPNFGLISPHQPFWTEKRDRNQPWISWGHWAICISRGERKSESFLRHIPQEMGQNDACIVQWPSRKYGYKSGSSEAFEILTSNAAGLLFRSMLTEERWRIFTCKQKKKQMLT